MPSLAMHSISPKIAVKFLFYHAGHSSMGKSKGLIAPIHDMVASVTPVANAGIGENFGSMSMSIDSEQQNAAEISRPATGQVAAAAPPLQVECLDTDFSKLIEIGNHSGDGLVLYEMRCQVSLNDQDYCPISGIVSATTSKRDISDAVKNGNTTEAAAIIVHSFTPDAVVPSSLALSQVGVETVLSPSGSGKRRPKSGNGELKPMPTVAFRVSGRSFIPTSRLPQNATLQVSISVAVASGRSVDSVTGKGGSTVLAAAAADDDEHEDINEAAGRDSATVGTSTVAASVIVSPVLCDSESFLTFELPSSALNELFSLFVAVTSASALDWCALSLKFQMVQPIDMLDLDAAGMGATSTDNGELGAHTSSTAVDNIIVDLCEGMHLPMYIYRDRPIKLLPNSIAKSPRPPHVNGDGEEIDLSSARAGRLVSIFSTNAIGDEVGFPFVSDAVSVTLHFPNNILAPVILSSKNPEYGVTMTPVAGIQTDNTAESEFRKMKGYKVDFLLKPLWVYFAEQGKDDEATQLGMQQCDRILVSVSLNGQNESAESCWAKLFYYGNLATKMTQSPTPPKGGFVSGSAINLTLDTYCPPRQAGLCVIRLRGAKDTSFGFGASMSETPPAAADGSPVTVITFEIPEPDKLKLLEPIMNGKDKMYFIDISVDGGNTFDESPTPTLQLK
jgi:hypothetical protein